MKIWDIHPGYLSQQSLLEEHRGLQDLAAAVASSKSGHSQHPEVLRWSGHGWAIRQRHRSVICEMKLRGYGDTSPVRSRSNPGIWPSSYIDQPHAQFQLLQEKYRDTLSGRIPLPNNVQQLWRQHKYSVLARDPKRYKDIGQAVADHSIEFARLVLSLVEFLRIPPGEGGIRNALQHMWGYVSHVGEQNNSIAAEGSLMSLLQAIQQNAKQRDERYILQSTSLSELMVWL